MFYVTGTCMYGSYAAQWRSIFLNASVYGSDMSWRGHKLRLGFEAKAAERDSTKDNTHHPVFALYLGLLRVWSWKLSFYFTTAMANGALIFSTNSQRKSGLTRVVYLLKTF